MSYEQFFKKAQEAKREPASPSRADAKPGRTKQPRRDVDALLRRSVTMKTRRRPPPPWKAVGGLALSLALAGFYLAAPEQVESLIERVEVRALGAATASEGAAKPAEKSSSGTAAKEKPAADDKTGGKDHGPEEKGAVAEDMSHFEKLRQRKEELDRREKELAELEEELQRQKVELDKRIQQLEEMRGQIAQILKDRVEVDQEKVTKLVDLYSNMKPKQAADVIGTINEELAVEVLAKMKKKNAAEIMNLLPAEKARVLSEKYTGYRRNHPEPKG